LKVAVVGLGKIGLPLACQIASSGIDVVGYDISERVVATVNSGKPPFPNEPGLQKKLSEGVNSKRLMATSDCQDALGNKDVIVICVPLLVDSTHHDPDFSILDKVCEEIGKFASDGALVILETTVPVGTTRNRVSGRISAASDSVGRSLKFEVAFSPERISSGSVFADLRRYPKIVGGATIGAGKRSEEFYKAFLTFDTRADLPKPNGVWLVDSCETAEMIKLAETTFRDVNIALANEFAKDCLRLGLKFQDIRMAANSQPFSNIHQAGISVGGHCIPVYPHLYLKNGSPSRLIPAAREINDSMPRFAASSLEKECGSLEGMNVLIAGISYRSYVKETAYSGAFELKKELENRGARVRAVDPMYASEELIALGFTPLMASDDIQAIVIHTHHSEFEAWTVEEFPHCKIILEGRDGPLLHALDGIFQVRPLF